MIAARGVGDLPSARGNWARGYFDYRKVAWGHVGAKTPPKCFVSSWVFHIISHYLKSIDSFYTKLGR